MFVPLLFAQKPYFVVKSNMEAVTSPKIDIYMVLQGREDFGGLAYTNILSRYFYY